MFHVSNISEGGEEQRRMESTRAAGRNFAAGCSQTCRRVTLSVAVVVATVTLVACVCVLVPETPGVDLPLQREERCEYRRCDLNLELHGLTQDPACSLCPPGWLWWGDRCYFFSAGIQDDLSWNKSVEFCRRYSSSLVVIEGPAEMEFLYCVRKKFPKVNFPWVGLTDAQEEGRWVWMDGSDLQRHVSLRVEWDSDQADCADLRGEKSLFAVRCDSYGPWICKKDS